MVMMRAMMIIMTIEMLEYARRAYSHPQNRLIWRIGKVGVPVLPKLGAELGYLRGRGPPLDRRINRAITWILGQKEIITRAGPLVCRDLLPGLSKFGDRSYSIIVNRRTRSLSMEGETAHHQLLLPRSGISQPAIALRQQQRN